MAYAVIAISTQIETSIKIGAATIHQLRFSPAIFAIRSAIDALAKTMDRNDFSFVVGCPIATSGLRLCVSSS